MDDIEGQSVFKQGKATLQMNKAKKALKYSTKTAKELLLGQREREGSSEDESEENNESETIEDTTNESNNKDSTRINDREQSKYF